MYIPIESEQQRHQDRSEARDRREREHDAMLRREAAVEPYWTGDVRLNMMRLVGLARFGEPVILPGWITRTLERRKGLKLNV